MTRELVLPETHEALLRRALKLEEDANLPQHLIDLYWNAERTNRRLFMRGVDDNLLVTILLLAGLATPAPPVSFLDKNAKRGDRVLVKHRDEWVWGTFKAYKAKKVIVQLDDGTAEDRECEPTHVRTPAREELALIQ